MEYTFEQYEKDQEFLEKHFKESEEYAKEQAYIERITEENKLNSNEQSRIEQANNKSNSRLLTYNGLSLTTRQWSEKLNVSFKTLNSRIARKWTIERALNTPIINH